jgi:hypothetical protein
VKAPHSNVAKRISKPSTIFATRTAAKDKKITRVEVEDKNQPANQP